jgi:hypothetical protein
MLIKCPRRFLTSVSLRMCWHCAGISLFYAGLLRRSFLEGHKNTTIDDIPLCFAGLSGPRKSANANRVSSLIAVGDGSSMNSTVTFGWTMSLPDGTRITSCSGPTPGSKGSSFRPKAYGMLPIVRFIFHFFSFCDARHTCETQLSTGKQFLLQRVKEYQHYTTYFPNTTLNKDWDVVKAIVATSESMNIVPFLSFERLTRRNTASYPKKHNSTWTQTTVTTTCSWMMILLFA